MKILFWALLLVILPSRAYAYIDPGAGSLVFQALVAGFFGAVFTIKMYWGVFKKKLNTLLGRDKPEETKPPEEKK